MHQEYNAICKQVVNHYFLFIDPTIRTREIIGGGSHERTWRGKYALL